MNDESGEELAFDVDLPEPPEKVWRALTVPALRDHWLRPETAGASAEVIDAEPPRQLRWRWHERDEEPGLVTVTLMPNGAGGTALRLVHQRRLVAVPKPANGNVMMMLAA